MSVFFKRGKKQKLNTEGEMKIHSAHWDEAAHGEGRRGREGEGGKSKVEQNRETFSNDSRR